MLFTVDAFMQSFGNTMISIGLANIPVFGPYLAAVFNGLQTKAATGSNRKALIGAYVTLWSTNAYGEIGAYYDAIEKLSASQVAAKIALHGMVGGISELAQGGNFGHGFASAGVTQGSSPLIKRLGHTKISRVFIAAIIGGLASRVTGGKFANGAVTGAFSRAFNDEKHKKNGIDELTDALNATANKLAETLGSPAYSYHYAKGYIDGIASVFVSLKRLYEVLPLIYSDEGIVKMRIFDYTVNQYVFNENYRNEVNALITKYIDNAVSILPPDKLAYFAGRFQGRSVMTASLNKHISAAPGLGEMYYGILVRSEGLANIPVRLLLGRTFEDE